jgi:hypothetical protein
MATKRKQPPAVPKFVPETKPVKLRLYDRIRSYDFGSHIPSEYLEGMVVGFDGGFIEMLVQKRVIEGTSRPVASNEIACTPQHGNSMMDDVSPRLVFLSRAPSCFSLDKNIAAALESFRATRRRH